MQLGCPSREYSRVRKLLVWFHVVTSIGWMILALCLATLIMWGLSTGDRSAFAMAHVLDVRLLQSLGTSGAFSGFMLAALTPWGYFRYWWVLLKVIITISQLYMGAFLLGVHLDRGDPGYGLVFASLLMVSALGFQAWVSLAKPWRLTPWASRKKIQQAPAWKFVAAIAVPVLDFVLWRAPLLSLLVVLVYPFWRRRELRSSQIA